MNKMFTSKLLVLLLATTLFSTQVYSAPEPKVTEETYAIPGTPNTTPQQLQVDLERLRTQPSLPSTSAPLPPAPAFTPAVTNTPPPQIVVPKPPTTSAARLEVKTPACVATNDISILLSPACLDTLRALGVPKGMGVPSASANIAIPGSNVGMQCMVSLWAGDRGSTSSSIIAVQVPNLYSCIEAGARLSYSIPGARSNIVAVDPTVGVISVDCQRDGDGKRLGCKPQPPIMAAKEEQAIPQAQPLLAVEPVAQPELPPAVDPVIRGPAPNTASTANAAGSSLHKHTHSRHRH